MPTELNITVLISGSGSNLQALIDQVHTPEDIPARIVKVISNKTDAYGLTRAQQAGISTQVIKHKHYPDRASFDQDVQASIEQADSDLVVLAGFMRILTSAFVEHFQGRLLNIHPSLLPNYKGTNTHQRVLDDGQSRHGVSVHYVTPELDDGPVILQAAIAITAEDTADTLAQRIHQQEHIIYPQVVRWCAEQRLSWNTHEPYPRLDGQLLKKPLLLS